MSTIRRLHLTSLLVLLAACTGANDEDLHEEEVQDPYERPDEARDIVSDELLETMEGLGHPIHPGLNPPDVSGTFHTDDAWAVYDETQGGWLDEPLLVCEFFYTLTCSSPTECTSEVDYVECAGGHSGVSTYVSGEGDCFTLYSTTSGTFEGCSSHSVSVLSGCMEAQGIVDVVTSGFGHSYTGASCDDLVAEGRMSGENDIRQSQADLLTRIGG